MSELTVKRPMIAPRETVWRALTTDEIAEWLWPPAFETHVSIDPRVGGSYRIWSASRGIAVSGEFLELTDGERYVQSWTWDGETLTSRVTLTLTDELVLVHEGLDEADVADHIQGWNDCFERLDEYVRN